MIRWLKARGHGETERRLLGGIVTAMAFHQPKDLEKEIKRVEQARRAPMATARNGDDFDAIVQLFGSAGVKVVDETKAQKP